MSIVVTELNYYPVKSLMGHRVESRAISETGFVNDREFMLVDQDNQFLTQREHTRLALVQPTLSNGHLRLSAPSMGPIEVRVVDDGERRQVTVWRDALDAIDMGELAANWFSAFLQKDVRLVRKAPDAVRQCDQKYATDESDQTAFADGYPFLLLSEASLQALNDRLDFPVPMNRFRPNIVVAGTEPFQEDTWSRLRIGEIYFDVVKPCARCKITTVDQATGVAGKEPLRTLATFRNFGGNVLFGQNLVHKQQGQIAVGDAVEVLA